MENLLRVERAKEIPRHPSLPRHHALIARLVAAAEMSAEQNFDPPVASKVRITKRARLDFVRGHSGLDQCAANGVRTAVAQILVIRIRSVDSDLEGRIPRHVRGDVVSRALVGSPNLC